MPGRFWSVTGRAEKRPTCGLCTLRSRVFLSTAGNPLEPSKSSKKKKSRKIRFSTPRFAHRFRHRFAKRDPDSFSHPRAPLWSKFSSTWKQPICFTGDVFLLVGESARGKCHRGVIHTERVPNKCAMLYHHPAYIPCGPKKCAML